MLLLSFTPQFSHAQADQFFTPINVLEVTFTENELLLYQHYAQSTDYSSVQLVQIGNLETIQQNGILDFTLPGENWGRLTAEATKVQWNDSTDYAWTGKIGDNGSLIFMSQSQGQIASIYVQGSAYSLLPIKPNVGVIAKHNPTALSTSCTDEFIEPPLESPPCSNDNCDAVITILFLITPHGHDFLLSQSNNLQWLYKLRLRFMEWNINSIFSNSSILGKSVNIIVKDFSYNPPGALDIIQAHQHLVNEIGAFGFNAHSERISNKADLVFVTSYESVWNLSGIAGIANIGPSFNSAWSIVSSRYLWNTLVFPHELGHLFGCRHEIEADNTPYLCGHAYNALGETVVWSTLSPGQIPFYSNPDMGTGSYNDPKAMNAQQIMTTGCQIADYYDNQDWTISIAGPDYTCDHTPQTYSVNTNTPPVGNSGQPPYLYEWFWTSSGIFSTSNPGTSLGTSSSITIGSVDCPFFFLRVRIVSLDGEIRFATRKIITLNNCPECPQINAKNSIGNHQTSSGVSILEVVPNPATNYFEARVFVPETDNVELALYNNNGQIIHILYRGVLEKGEQKLVVLQYE